MAEGEKIRVGGLLRCCVKTIRERERTASVGDIVQCLRCSGRAIYKMAPDPDNPQKEVPAWHWKPD